MSDNKASTDRICRLISASRQQIMSKEHIVFFGVTEGAIVAKGVIEEFGASIYCIVDNNPLRQGGQWQGVPIYSPDYLKGMDSVLVILCTEHMGRRGSSFIAMVFRMKIFWTWCPSVVHFLLGVGICSNAWRHMQGYIRKGRSLSYVPILEPGMHI